MKLKNQLLISILFLLLIAIPTKIYSQHNYFFEAGKIEAQNNIYLSDGFNLNIGYQYNFPKNIILNPLRKPC